MILLQVVTCSKIRGFAFLRRRSSGGLFQILKFLPLPGRQNSSFANSKILSHLLQFIFEFNKRKDSKGLQAVTRFKKHRYAVTFL